MIFKTILYYSDGTPCYFVSEIDKFEGNFELGSVGLCVTKTVFPGEFELTISPSGNVALKSLEIWFEIGTESVKLFNAGTGTNSWTSICDGGSKFTSRELIMAKGEDFFLNVAFTSYETFYTTFSYADGILKALYDLEDKTVYAGNYYRLETILLNETLDAPEFFEMYVSRMCEKIELPPKKAVPAGWSSWSCLYGNINEETIIKQSKSIAEIYKGKGAEIIQMDDGWQKEPDFSDYWTEEPSRFPSLGKLCSELNGMGFRFGLWIAPGLIDENSTHFGCLKDKICLQDGEMKPSFNKVYPLNLEDPSVLQEVHDIFERAVKDYGVVYFKIDFPVNLIMRAGFDNIPVRYENDYSVALYRKFVKLIRNTVGPDVFLLACGSPIGESMGVFDAIRVTPDISWSGFGEAWHPGPWAIISNNIANMMRRAPMNGKIFQNDPDGLIVRDYFTKYSNDGVNLTYGQAEMLTIACAFCGGALLLNEEADILSEERRELFADIIPPLGKAALPVDFWESPYPTRAFLKVDNFSVRTEFRIFYNYDDAPVNHTLSWDCHCVIIDCRSKKIVSSGSKTYEFTLNPQSAKVFLVKSIANAPMILYSDENIYLGAGTHSEVVAGKTAFIDVHSTISGNIYLFEPEGADCTFFLNGEQVQKETLPCENIQGGRVYKVQGRK